jgi:hypothetical protein
MTKTGDAGKDLICCLGSRRRASVLRCTREVSVDGGLELADAAVDTAPKLLLRQQGEPPLDQIGSGRVLRGEVQMVAGPLASHCWIRAVLWVA